MNFSSDVSSACNDRQRRSSPISWDESPDRHLNLFDLGDRLGSRDLVLGTGFYHGII